jgi:probable lipoprotein NlpC
VNKLETPDKISKLVKRYEGIPYVQGGRSLSGLDCLGLAHLFYKDLGIDFPDGDGKVYTDRWVFEDPNRYLRGVLTVGKEVLNDLLRPLDFVYFRIGRFISHGGVMVDSKHFIHVLQEQTVHVSELNRRWSRRLVGARRLIKTNL